MVGTLARKLIGSTWRGTDGRTYEVIEMASVWRYLVRSTDMQRVGEMTARSIRDSIRQTETATNPPSNPA